MMPYVYRWEPAVPRGICSQLQGIAQATDSLLFNGFLAKNLAPGQAISLDKVSKRIAIECDEDNSLANFTIFGLFNGQEISETMAGSTADSIVYSSNLYSVVKRISVNKGLSGITNIGFNCPSTGNQTCGVTNWFPVDLFRSILNISLGAFSITSSTTYAIKYTLEATFDDVEKTPESELNIFNPVSNMIAATSTQTAQLTLPCKYLRFVLNNGTNFQSKVYFYITQQGIN